MAKSVDGIYSNEKVELVERFEIEGPSISVAAVQPVKAIDLCERGINESQVRDLRRRLGTFREDWDSPEMSAYDLLPPR